MKLLITFIIIAFLLKAIIVFIRCEPRLDLTKTVNGYALLLWYNKYNWTEIDNRRVYIKLIEI